MKKSFLLGALVISAAVLAGCTTQMAACIKAAGESKAALHFTVVTPQGTLTYDRANPEGTNNITVGGQNGVTTK